MAPGIQSISEGVKLGDIVGLRVGDAEAFALGKLM